MFAEISVVKIEKFVIENINVFISRKAAIVIVVGVVAIFVGIVVDRVVAALTSHQLQLFIDYLPQLPMPPG